MLYHSIFSAAVLLAGLANAAPAAHPQDSTLARRQVLPTWPSDGSWVPDNTGAWVPEVGAPVDNTVVVEDTAPVVTETAPVVTEPVPEIPLIDETAPVVTETAPVVTEPVPEISPIGETVDETAVPGDLGEVFQDITMNIPEVTNETENIPESTDTEPSGTPVPAGSGSGKTVAYFGQAGSSDTDSLAEYCENTAIDVVVLGFVTKYAGEGGLPASNWASYQPGATLEGSELYPSTVWADDIPKCQGLGKQVLISIGGESMNSEELHSEQEAQDFAKNMWNLFGPGTELADKRPFGDAVVDGFDFDIESKKGAFIDVAIATLRDLINEHAAKKLILTAAPQCVFPDASLGDNVYAVDELYIQHYNNPGCHGANFVESFKAWSASVAENSQVGTKIFAGFPGDLAGAGSGHVSHTEIADYLSQVKSLENFGGVMMWEATGARHNTNAEGKSLLDVAAESVHA